MSSTPSSGCGHGVYPAGESRAPSVFYVHWLLNLLTRPWMIGTFERRIGADAQASGVPRRGWRLSVVADPAHAQADCRDIRSSNTVGTPTGHFFPTFEPRFTHGS